MYKKLHILILLFCCTTNGQVFWGLGAIDVIKLTLRLKSDPSLNPGSLFPPRQYVALGNIYLDEPQLSCC